ncbi:OmpA family protein [Rhodoblastus sp.]|uniref:OmpA family protein n=1 Tax=Rhodoblastus sp. TaxID=1962975 RepID=UPI00260613BA|nr:OmpA family protein [Rhodoblastus sp.]
MAFDGLSPEAALRESGDAHRVAGNADSERSSRRDIELSPARAAAVAALVAQGVDSRKLAAAGRGDESPIAAENGPDSRRDRRVVFKPVPQAERKN